MIPTEEPFPENTTDPAPAPRKRGGARPGAGRPRKDAVAASEIKAREARANVRTGAAAKLLVYPPLVTSMIGAPPFVSRHMTGMVGPTAEVLAVAAEGSPHLARILDSGGGTGILLAAAAMVGFIGPPIMWMLGSRDMALAMSREMGVEHPAEELDPSA